MKRILTIAAVLLAMVLVGCNTSPLQPSMADNSDQPDSLTGSITEPISLGIIAEPSDSVRALPEALALASTYAFGVIPWHDNIEGDEDWMAVFYLPYNPGTVYFYGRTRIGYWQNFGPPLSQLHDARWTSSGFRVMIFMGDKVTWPCGTSPSSYRLQY